MKKVVSVLVLLMLSVCMAVPAAAYYTIPSTVSYWYEEGGDTYLGTLPTSTLPDSAKDFLREWLTSDYSLLTYRPPSSNTFDFYIFHPDCDTDMEMSLYNKSSTYKNQVEVNRTGSVNFKYKVLSFKFESGSFLTTTNEWENWNSGSGRVLGYIIAGGYMQDHEIMDSEGSTTPYTGTDCYVDFSGLLYLVDDDGLFSDDGSSSSEPSSSTPAIDFPVIPPSDSEYVPYDTTLWNSFLDNIKQSVGSSTNIGFLVLAFIAAILIVIRVVKMFTKA